MIHLELGEARIFVRPGATDMRKQINGLVLLVQEEMRTSPFETALFVFCNAQRQLLKAVYWDRTGFCLWMKRLEKGRFPWPRTAAEVRREAKHASAFQQNLQRDFQATSVYFSSSCARQKSIPTSTIRSLIHGML